MRTAIAWSAFVVLIGCGNNSPDVSTTQDNICDQIAKVACFDFLQCCSEGELEAILHVNDPPSQVQCEDDIRTTCERARAQVDFSIKNKRVKFDAKSMNACLDAFVAPDGTCAMIADKAPWIDACMAAGFAGTVEAGGACDFGYECVKDTICNGSRICTARASAGMPCTNTVINNNPPTSNCASGLYCPLAAMSTCQPKIAQGGVCKNDVDCMDGLFCDSQDTQTCTARPAIGQACSPNPSLLGSTCGDNTCLRGTCADTGLSCSGKFNCLGHCSNAPTTTCTTDVNCNTLTFGTCSGTTTLCTSASGCLVGSACVFPNKCMHPECTGAVCAEPHVTVDFCEAGTELPDFALPPAQNQSTGT